MFNPQYIIETDSEDSIEIADSLEVQLADSGDLICYFT